MSGPDVDMNPNRDGTVAIEDSAPWSDILARVALLSLAWWIISAGSIEAWIIGLPAVALATVASRQLMPAPLPTISLRGLPVFLQLFLRESVRGGLDVATRTLAHCLRIEPGFRHYTMRLTTPNARVVLMNCISLLPGTLAADLDGDRVVLHLLDTDVDPEPDLRRLEDAIAGLFGLELEETDDH